MSLEGEELGWGGRVEGFGTDCLALTVALVICKGYRTLACAISFSPESSFMRSSCCYHLCLASVATKLGQITHKQITEKILTIY